MDSTSVSPARLGREGEEQKEQEERVTVFDPYPKFAYTGSLRPFYPLSKNKKVPDHIVRPNYAREEVRYWFWSYWWDVSTLYFPVQSKFPPSGPIDEN